MNDIQRLRQWMTDRNLKMGQLSREMDTPYITLYTILERRERVTYGLVSNFAQRYGADEAQRVFRDFLAPLEVA